MTLLVQGHLAKKFFSNELFLILKSAPMKETQFKKFNFEIRVKNELHTSFESASR